jgi:microsomal dipeptidase-like Zn-dependent dipeptidase
MQLLLGGYVTKDLPDWEKKVQTLLKVEILKRNLTYKQVSEKLSEMGIVESEPNIRNKLARGTFSAVFLIQCLTAIGATSVSFSPT